MLNFVASKPRVRGGVGLRVPPGSAPETNFTLGDLRQFIQLDEHLFNLSSK